MWLDVIYNHTCGRGHEASTTPPGWPSGRSAPAPDLLGDLAVWRAAQAIPDSDPRPTGPAQPAKALARWQNVLDARLGAGNTATLTDWTSFLHALVPATRHDDYTPQLAEHLADLASTGIDAKTLLHIAAGAPLPDDHATSALWWRFQNHLPNPQNLGKAFPLPWPTEDYTTVHDRDAGLDMRAEPHRGGHHKRHPAPVQHDQPRGPGMAR